MPPPPSAANPLAEVQRKTPRPFGRTACAVRVPQKAGAEYLNAKKTVLAVDLPEFQQMPYLTSENGDVTLSQIGIRIRNADMHCTVDEVDKLSVQLRDGSEYVILDENADIDRTLYTCGFNSTEDTDRIDTEIAVLARAFDLDNVQSVTINGEVYPLS